MGLHLHEKSKSQAIAHASWLDRCNGALLRAMHYAFLKSERVRSRSSDHQSQRHYSCNEDSPLSVILQTVFACAP